MPGLALPLPSADDWPVCPGCHERLYLAVQPPIENDSRVTASDIYWHCLICDPSGLDRADVAAPEPFDATVRAAAFAEIRAAAADMGEQALAGLVVPEDEL